MKKDVERMLKDGWSIYKLICYNGLQDLCNHGYLQNLKISLRIS